MKVLFAVNNEDVSEAIVKKYQKRYKEIISYKNVYYFNAILKEIQKDKTYDRIVISEDLEQFTNTSYEQMDKFIFERLDSISDEAENNKGKDVPIILICTERRNKSEDILVKLFGIGIYNAIIGNDRSVDEVCRLINRPRSKREAKTYYGIDSEKVSYKAENEDDVSEVEIQNILAHFKRLGKNETRYIESYNNIASQYNDNQLKVISKFLPLGVRAVLEEKSPKYQQVMAFNKSVSESLRQKEKQKNQGVSQKLLTNPKRIKTLENPIVVPSTMNSAQNVKKLTRTPVKKKNEKPEETENIQKKYDGSKKENTNNNNRLNIDKIESVVSIDVEEPMGKAESSQPKRGRGRPRKNQLPVEEVAVQPKRGRGRPRKNPLPEENDNIKEKNEELDSDEVIRTPKIYDDIIDNEEEQKVTTLPGLDMIEKEENDDYEEEIMLPGLDEFDDDKENEEFSESNSYEDNSNDDENYDFVMPNLTKHEEIYEKQNQYESQPIEPIVKKTNLSNLNPINNYYDNNVIDLSDVLQGNKKLAAFVGTSKNGTSFIVNNIAELLSSLGVNVAILDTTRNKNSYYIYTKNEEELRKIAMSSISNLANGVANGIRVNNNLSVYTSLPNEDTGIENVQNVLSTLMRSHTVVLIDCDFETPRNFFSAIQELYLVQTMDVLTIQPLTAFLKELVTHNILNEDKIRIIINKYVKVRGVSEREIVGGMAYYNDPAMTYQTELFDKTMVKYITIPFEEETYIKYLDGLINCEISLKGYSKIFMQNLRQLGNMIYPVASNKGKYTPPALGTTGKGTFSSSMNNTLEQMKRNY